MMRFQSTHPRGVRPEGRELRLLRPGVSIHAPTRGATYFRILTIFFRIMFQSTHPRGVRLQNQLILPLTFGFQSTHPRGVRHHHYDKTYLSHKFQSTHPRGVRPICLLRCYLNLVSIHAPTRGATAYSAKYRILIYKSSHFANINQTITFKVIKSLEFL